MDCSISNLNLSFDKESRLRSTITRLADGDSKRMFVLAGYLNDENFHQYVAKNLLPKNIINGESIDFNNITKEDLVKINKNSLYSLLRDYMLQNYKSVNNTKSKTGSGRVMGFTSITAKYVAQNKVAELIIDEYRNRLNKIQGKPKSIALEVINEVIDKINDEFNIRIENFALEITNTDGYSNEAKKLAKEIIDIIKEIKSLVDTVNNTNKIIREYNSNIDNLAEEILQGKDNKNELIKIREEITEKRNRLRQNNIIKKDKVNELKTRRYILGQTLFKTFSVERNDVSSIRDLNYANLIAQVKENTNEFFFYVFNNKKMTEYIKDFNNIDDIAKNIENMNGENFESIYNDENLDETSKSWEDNMFKSVGHSISGEMKHILSTIPNLTGKFNTTSERQELDTNNELGVSSYMDAGFLTVQMYSFGDYTNVESMIKSLDNASQSIPGLYGLGDLVNRMKNNPVLARFIWQEFSKPVIHKVMCTIRNVYEKNGIKFDYSNNTAFYKTNLIYSLMHNIRGTFRNAYNVNDSDKIKYYIDKLHKDNIRKYKKLTNKDKEEIFKGILDIIHKYFPNIQAADLQQLFNNADNTIIIDLLDEINNIIFAVKELNEQVENSRKLNDEEYEKERKQCQLDVYNNKKVPAPTKNDYIKEVYELTPRVKAIIIKIADIFSKNLPSKSKLTSKNAENSSAADIGKNCYISRFFEQILSGNEKDSNAGLKALGEYIMQGISSTNPNNQYTDNPLFFGVKDETGRKLYNGMFTRRGNYAIPNRHAKQLLSYSLFDGTKNTNKGVGKTYSTMSNLDFFITQYMAYCNNVTEDIADSYERNDIKNRTATYPMRIGSDAPKIYMIRAPRYFGEDAAYAIYNHLLDEINMFVNAINVMFKEDSDGNYKLRTDITNLFGNAYYDEKIATDLRKNAKDKSKIDYTKAIIKIVKDENGEHAELVGNMFNFNRLFKLNNLDANKELASLFSLYGGGDNSLFVLQSDGNMTINLNRVNSDNSFIKLVKDNRGLNGKFVLALQPSHHSQLVKFTKNWCNEFLKDARTELADYINAIPFNKDSEYSSKYINEFLLNLVNMNMNYDDLFEGDFKYYKSARDFFKRTKETQAGGQGYFGSSAYDFDNKLKDTSFFGNKEVIKVKQSATGEKTELTRPTYNGRVIAETPIVARNGFRAVTIYNTVKASDSAVELKQTLYDEFIAEGYTEENAEQRANKISAAYFKQTKVNDAQSYITFEEWIRRRYADGTIEKYQDLIGRILDPNVKAEDINIDEVNERIQVGKNFYYDKVYDSTTNSFYPRQIKNAEFVIIPKLLPKDSNLTKIYDWMIKNDIGQLNTAETDKAAKKNIFTIFDENTGELIDNFESSFSDNYIQTYYYKYLYKQQEVPQHMMNESNKFGAQVSKKILDNISNYPKEIQQAAKKYQDAVASNLKEDFVNFLDGMGWKYDRDTRKIVNAEYATMDANGQPLPKEQIDANRETLNFSNFYQRAREEINRLGLDSNFIDYVLPNEFGVPNMPMAMNVVINKLESVAQSLFNSGITRQTLPGWHAAQITDVGWSASKKLRFDAKKGIMEIRIPRWSNLIPKGKNEEENKRILEQIEKEGLDIQLIYRIPTEGKQSITRAKVVGFVDDCLGSTIVVPDDWVTQTGSDFDVDSVYGICWEMYKTIDKDGNVELHKYKYKEEDCTDEQLYISYINNRIDNKVKRDDLGQKIKAGIEKFKNDFNEEKDEDKEGISNAYKKLQDERKEAYKLLPYRFKEIVFNNNKKAVANSNKLNSIQIRELYNETIKDLRKRLIARKSKLTEATIDNINNYTNILTTIVNVLNKQDGINSFDKDAYNNAKQKVVQDIIEEADKDYFERIKKEAKENGLPTFEEFKQFDFVDKLSRKARNNYILDKMMEIMADSHSREEQYGRSHFEDISNANEVIDSLYGIDKAVISPYNPVVQIGYMADAMSGAALKARSVMWDTCLSKCNYLQVDVKMKGLESNIGVALKLDSEPTDGSKIIYNRKAIEKSYGKESLQDLKNNKVVNKDNIFSDNSNKVLFTPTKFGWSNNNKNIIGEFVTTYSAETTLYQSDAIKEGSIPNVNNYTFGVYKYLTCIGLDYETVIGFMRQPIMNELVKIYNASNAIFTTNDNNPISSTINVIVAKLNYNIQKGRKVVHIYEILPLFKELYGIDISKLKNNQLFNIKLHIDKDNLFKRIKYKGEYNKYIAAFDLGNLLIFRQILNTTRELNDIIQFTHIDKTGAKISIHATKKVINVIDKYKDNQTLTKNGKSIASLIFTDTIKNSEYTLINAVYQYATKMSIEVNSRLIKIESGGYYEILKNVESAIGKELTNNQYTEYRQYLLAYIYSKLNKLIQPVILNKKMQMSITSVNNSPFTEEETQELNSEITRIFGYGDITTGSFECEDINNVTDEELEQYNKLTPAQKVLFIQKAFKDDAGVFKYVNVSLFRNTDKNHYDTTRQYLSFEDSIYNIEDIYIDFESAFDNNNRLIKLAAIDLIKYAFIVEGFNFRYNNITKMIPNSILYKQLNVGGLDIVNNENGIAKLINIVPSKIFNDEFIDNYVRSHSYLVPIVCFPKYTEEKMTEHTGNSFNGPNINDEFVRLQRFDYLVVLFNSSDNRIIYGRLKKQLLNKKINYVRINRAINCENKVTTLYKIINSGYCEALYLVPMNILYSYETSDTNACKSNRYNTTLWYSKRIIEIEKRISVCKNELDDALNHIENVFDKIIMREKFYEIIQNFINHSNADYITTFFNNKFALHSLLSSPDEYIKNGVEMMINDIKFIIHGMNDGDNLSEKYIINQNIKISEIFDILGKSTIQYIKDDDGKLNEVVITKIFNSKTVQNTYQKLHDKNVETNLALMPALIRMKQSPNICPNNAITYKIKIITKGINPM